MLFLSFNIYLAAPSIQIEAVEYSDNVDESLLQNGGSNETDVAGIIEQKKRELEKLVQDIHSLEISSPASKSPGSKFRSTIPLPEDLYQRGISDRLFILISHSLNFRKRSQRKRRSCRTLNSRKKSP